MVTWEWCCCVDLCWFVLSCVELKIELRFLGFRSSRNDQGKHDSNIVNLITIVLLHKMLADGYFSQGMTSWRYLKHSLTFPYILHIIQCRKMLDSAVFLVWMQTINREIFYFLGPERWDWEKHSTFLIQFYHNCISSSEMIVPISDSRKTSIKIKYIFA